MAFTAGSLGSGQIASSQGVLYTVPALSVAYLKSLSISHTSATPQTVIIYLKESGGTARRYRTFVLNEDESADVISPGSSIQLSAGDTLEAETTSATTVDWFLTGVVEA